MAETEFNNQSSDAVIAGKQPDETHIQEVVANLAQEHNLDAKESAFMAQFLRDNPSIDPQHFDFVALTVWIRGNETDSLGTNDTLSQTLGAEGWHVTPKALRELI